MADPTFHFIVVVDVEGFGRRTNPVQAALRTAMYEVVHRAFDDAHVDRQSVIEMDRGDGILMLVPTAASSVTLAGNLITALEANLREKSKMSAPDLQMRMRVSLHQGVTEQDANGWVGEAINTAARLVDAPPLRETLKAAPGALLAFIVSDAIYQSVIKHGYRYIDAASFAAVRLDVKELHEQAWIQVPGRSFPPGVEPAQPVSEEPGPTPDRSFTVNGAMTVNGDHISGDQVIHGDQIRHYGPKS